MQHDRRETSNSNPSGNVWQVWGLVRAGTDRKNMFGCYILEFRFTETTEHCVFLYIVGIPLWKLWKSTFMDLIWKWNASSLTTSIKIFLLLAGEITHCWRAFAAFQENKYWVPGERQLPLAPARGDPMASSGLYKKQHITCTHSCTHTNTNRRIKARCVGHTYNPFGRQRQEDHKF